MILLQPRATNVHLHQWVLNHLKDIQPLPVKSLRITDLAPKFPENWSY